MEAGSSHGLLTFQGLNFKANIWINGALVANTTQTAGAYRYTDIDLSGIAQGGATVGIAVEILPGNDQVRLRFDAFPCAFHVAAGFRTVCCCMIIISSVMAFSFVAF